MMQFLLVLHYTVIGKFKFVYKKWIKNTHCGSLVQIKNRIQLFNLSYCVIKQMFDGTLLYAAKKHLIATIDHFNIGTHFI